MARIEPRTVTLRDGATITIRSGEEGDALASLNLRARCARESRFISTLPEDVTESLWQQLKINRGYAADPCGLLLYAEAPGHGLVGGLGVRHNTRRRLRHWVEVGMTIVSEWQGRGVGRAILTAALDFAAANPAIEKVCLSVIPDNEPAVRLYHAVGFREEGRQFRQMKQPDGTYHDHAFMAVYVKPGIAPEGFLTWPLAPVRS